MILHPAPVSTRQLTYDAAKNEFVGDISDTHGFGRVYDDACDEGLTLVSARTGREVVFVVTRTVRDNDGDVSFWLLAPAVSAEPFYTIRLFND